MSKPPSRRRRRGSGGEEHSNGERWAISYMDMVTVMMCLFIVLFAISQVDQHKFEQLSKSLGAAFGGQASQLTVLDGSDGLLEGQTGSNGPGQQDPKSVDAKMIQLQQVTDQEKSLQVARQEISNMQELRQYLESDLQAKGLADEVSFRYTERGLVVGLVTDNVFFQPSQATLSSTTQQVLDTMAPRLRDLPNGLSVEGHANILPADAPYETNWELSVDRATKVTRRLVEVDGIPGNRIQATGFGDTRPLATGNDPASLAMNRRVDIVVETTVTGEAREKMAQLLDGAQAGG